MPIESLSTVELIALAKTKVMNMPVFRTPKGQHPTEADIQAHKQVVKAHNQQIFDLWSAVIERWAPLMCLKY
jgi:hypothetical protein